MSALKSFGLPGSINGPERMLLLKRDSDGKPDLDKDGNNQYVQQPRFLVVSTDEDGKQLTTKLIRRDHKGDIIPGPTEIEINMRMDPTTRQAIPGSGIKVFAQVVDIPTSKSVPNPAYYEPVTNDKGHVTAFTGFDFHVDGTRKKAVPENYKPQTAAVYETAVDARIVSYQKQVANLETGIKAQSDKIDALINSLKPADVIAPVVADVKQESGGISKTLFDSMPDWMQKKIVEFVASK